MTKASSSRNVDHPDDEFGVNPGMPASNGIAGAGDKGKGKEEGVEGMQFLDYVTCSICGYPFYSKNEPDRKFWMTSCGHILCGSRDHNHVKGRCTKCKKEEIEVYPVDENIHPDLKTWFGHPAENSNLALASLKRTYNELEVGILAVNTFQNGELMRLVKQLRLADERKEENIKLVKAELGKMAMMKKDLVETRAQLLELQKRNEELVRENDHLKSTQQPHRFPPPPLAQGYNTHLNPLTPVAEESEDMDGGYSDSGPASIQRFEFGLANDRPARGFDQYSTPRTHPGRLTLPLAPLAPTERPMTADPYDRHREAHGSRSAPTRVNLEKYRMADHTLGVPSTPYSTHPYHRPGSAMARPGSARPFTLARGTGGGGGSGGGGGGGFASMPARRTPGPLARDQGREGQGRDMGDGGEVGDGRGGEGFLEGLRVGGRSNVFNAGDAFIPASNSNSDNGYQVTATYINQTTWDSKTR